MGGKSTVDVEVLNSTISSSLANVFKTCESNATNSFNVKLGSVAKDVTFGGNTKQIAKADLMDCSQTNDIKASIKSEMNNAIKAKSSIQDNNLFSGDLGIFSQSATNSKTENKAILTMDTKDIMGCYAKAKNEIKIEIENVGGSFTWTSEVDQNTASSLTKCVQDSKIAHDLAQTMQNDIDATSKKQGILAQLADNSANLVMFCVIGGIFFGFFGICIAYFKMKADEKKKDAAIPGSTLPTSGLPETTLVPAPSPSGLEKVMNAAAAVITPVTPVTPAQ